MYSWDRHSAFAFWRRIQSNLFFLIWVSPLSPPNQGRTFLNLRNGVFDFVIERIWRHSVPQESTAAYLHLHSLLKKQMGLIFFVLCWKLAKSPRSQGVKKVNAFFVQNTHVKRTKWFYFWNNCMRKRQRLKTTVFVWQMTWYLHVGQETIARKLRKLFTFFWFWLQ